MKIINKENGESFETGIKTPFFSIDGKQLVTGDIVKLKVFSLGTDLEPSTHDYNDTMLVSFVDNEFTIYGASNYDSYFKNSFETDDKKLNLLQLLKEKDWVYYLDSIGDIESLGEKAVDYNSWFYIEG